MNSNALLDASHSPAPITLDGGQGTQLFSVASGGKLALNDLTLHDGAGSEGGAIDNNGSLTVTDSTLSGNVGMGGAINNNGTLMVSNSSFSDNSTPNDGVGGAIASLAFGSVTVTNSTFSGNSASGSYGLGGAIACCGTVSSGGPPSSGGSLTLTSSTFSGNSAAGGGSSIFLNVGTIELGADIFANSSSGSNCYLYGGTVDDAGYNVDTDGSCTSGKMGDTSANPSLGSLANNGGRTPTFALLAGSPAIGAIPAPAGLCPALDQRHYHRHASACDIGAFETGARPDYGDVPPAGPSLTNLFAGTHDSSSNYGNAVTASVARSGFALTIEGQNLGSSGTVSIDYSDGTSASASYAGSNGSVVSVAVPADIGANAGVDDISVTPLGSGTSNVLPLYVTPVATTISAFTGATTPNTASVNGTGAGTPWSISADDSGTGDSGDLDVAQYTTDPTGAPVGPPGAQDYFDVHLASGTVTQVTITDCTPNGGSIYWYNPALHIWQQPTHLANESSVNGCAQLIIDDNALDRPNVSDLRDAIFAGNDASPTYAPVTHFRAIHRGPKLVFTWRMANHSGVVGFNLYAGAHKLNARIVPVHTSPRYTVRTPWRHGKRGYTLQIVLRNGRHLTARTP